MIVAILPNTSSVESLLNNLDEADFNLADVSVIMQDRKLRDKIAKDTGPFKGIKPAGLAGALTQAGISSDRAKHCSDAIASGKVLVAMSVDPKYADAAKRMFQDHSPEFISG